MPLFLVAPAAVVVEAIFALMFLLAWAVWGKSITNSLNVEINVGPVSLNLFGWVADILERTYALLLYFLDAAVHPVANFIMAPIAAFDQFINSTLGAIQQLTVAVLNLQGNVQPYLRVALDIAGLTEQMQLLYTVEAYIDNRFAQVWNSVSQTANITASSLGQAEQFTMARINELRNEFAHIEIDPNTVANIAATTAGTVVAAALNPFEALISDVYAQATHYAGDLFATAESDINTALVTAEQYAQSLAVAAAGITATDIDQIISGALSGIYTDIDTAIEQTVDVAAGADADVIAGLREIPIGAIGDLAGVATLAGATALTLTRYLRDCGIPNCRNLGKYGNELQSLLSVVGAGEFLALVAELIHHPSGAADLFGNTLGPIVNAGEALTRELLGV